MSHELHVCEGLILGQQDFGEANRLYYVLTAEFGRVVALAQGVRYLKSKLRYHLREGEFSSLTLVRGREFWRIVGAQSVFIADSRTILKLRLCQLLIRLLRGETRNDELFNIVAYVWRFLSREMLSREELEVFETIAVATILANLGYLDTRQDFNGLLEPSDWRREVLIQPRERQTRMIEAINQALIASQL